MTINKDNPLIKVTKTTSNNLKYKLLNKFLKKILKKTTNTKSKPSKTTFFSTLYFIESSFIQTFNSSN